jgi:hypothetical protein
VSSNWNCTISIPYVKAYKGSLIPSAIAIKSVSKDSPSGVLNTAMGLIFLLRASSYCNSLTLMPVAYLLKKVLVLNTA